MFYSKLKDLVNDKSKSEYTIEELLEYFGDSTIKIGLLVSTIITSLPLPPMAAGTESIPGGLLCIFFSLQGILGMKHIYLPQSLKEIKVDISLLFNNEYLESVMEFIDNYFVPKRQEWVFNRMTELLMYCLVILHAVLMIIPIVFTTMLPSQMITAMAICWLLGDGYFVIVSMIIALVMFLLYVIVGVRFTKWMYRNRKYWTFGYWK